MKLVGWANKMNDEDGREKENEENCKGGNIRGIFCKVA